jgi:hypothetical protein
MLVGRGTVRTVERYRVQLTMQVDHADPDALGEWAFAVLDGLHVVPQVAEADVTATLARGCIEYEPYVTATTSRRPCIARPRRCARLWRALDQAARSGLETHSAQR